MVTILRLDPAHPPLWRTSRELQFGLDGVATVTDPVPWQERVVHELDVGMPDSDIDGIARAYGVTPREIRRFLAGLGAAIVGDVGRQSAPSVVAVHASGLPGTDEVVAGAAAGGVCFAEADARGAGTTAARALRVLITHHTVDLEQVRSAMSDDIPHLPVVLRGGLADVGPLVVPGRTPCLVCIDTENRARDSAWPTMRAQLEARAPAAISPALAHEAGLVAAALLRTAAERRSRSVTMSAGSTRRRWRSHAVSPSCACRSL